ncbi:TPA: hypothetical protein ROX98_000540 [Bacillus pseudomycoides]|nr:hypothetical protein [Bacillus pseudomycoides]
MTLNKNRELAILMQLSLIENMKHEIQFLQEQIETYATQKDEMIKKQDNSSQVKYGIYSGYIHCDQRTVKTLEKYVEKLQQTIEMIQGEEGKTE